MKTSLKVCNRTQYTNHQMNNAVTNQIYPKKSQYISLDRIFGINLKPHCHQDSYTHYHTSQEVNRYANQLATPGF